MRSKVDGKDDVVLARYRARYGRQDLAFRVFDFILGAFIWRRRSKNSTHGRRLRRILLVNAGHLGDAILSTALLPVLHLEFPGVEIGFLTGTYSRVVVEGHPLLARCHFIDHWYQSRQATPRWRRAISYWAALPKIARELRATNYDMAIDVRAWFPNLIPLLWLSGIPIRVGYDRLGFGHLLTHRVRYIYGRRHELDYQLALLRILKVSEKSIALAWPTLTPASEDAVRQAKSLLSGVTRYRILHPIASTHTRDWTARNWQALARKLLSIGVTPVVTGSGQRDRVIAEEICAAVPGTINAVDKTSWGGLLALVEQAEAVYAVETSVGHVASALRRPVIALYGGMADPSHWAPLGATVASRILPCHPCLIKGGCASRECIVGVTLKDVLEASDTAMGIGT